MKKIIFSLMFLGMMFVVAENATAQQRACSQFRDSTEVAVYANTSFKGKCVNLKTGTYRSATRLKGVNLNMQISSIIIGRKAKVRLCSEYNLRGTCKILTRSSNNLQQLNWDNVTRSIQVLLKSDNVTPPTPSNTQAPSSAYKICANEGQNCSYTGTGRVAYGAKGRFVYKNVSRGLACTNAAFGDPIPGTEKKCYVRLNSRNGRITSRPRTNQPPRNTPNKRNENANRQGPPKGYVFCANEGQRCNTGDPELTSIVYGANGKYKSRSVRNGVACNTRVFNDPAPGVPKKCYKYRKAKSNSGRSSTPISSNSRAPYDIIRNAAIPGNNTKSINGSRATCKKACDGYGWCKSFDFHKGKNKCDLSNKNARTASLKRNYPGNPYDHYSKSEARRDKPTVKPQIINGRNVSIVNYNGGTFTQGSNGKWLEYKKGKRGVHATFTETGRDEWSVYLRKSDGSRIQLDLYKKDISINGRQIYNIVSFS